MGKETANTPLRHRLQGVIASGALAMIVGLVLASLSVAGVVDFGFAAILLILAWGATVAAIYAWEPLWVRYENQRKTITFIGALIAGSFFVLIGVYEWKERPIERAFPAPPLTLMLPLKDLQALLPDPSTGEWPEQLPLSARVSAELAKLPIRIVTSRLGKPLSGYAGFVLDNEKDDVMLAIPNVAFRNASDQKISLRVFLTVEGEGLDLSVEASEKGRWQRQLDKNDWMTTGVDRDGTKYVDFYLDQPIVIGPGEVVDGNIPFVLPNIDADERQKVLKIDQSDRYKFTIRILAEGTGQSISRNLPTQFP